MPEGSARGAPEWQAGERGAGWGIKMDTRKGRKGFTFLKVARRFSEGYPHGLHTTTDAAHPGRAGSRGHRRSLFLLSGHAMSDHQRASAIPPFRRLPPFPPNPSPASPLERDCLAGLAKRHRRAAHPLPRAPRPCYRPHSLTRLALSPRFAAWIALTGRPETLFEHCRMLDLLDLLDLPDREPN